MQSNQPQSPQQQQGGLQQKSPTQQQQGFSPTYASGAFRPSHLSSTQQQSQQSPTGMQQSPTGVQQQQVGLQQPNQPQLQQQPQQLQQQPQLQQQQYGKQTSGLQPSGIQSTQPKLQQEQGLESSQLSQQLKCPLGYGSDSFTSKEVSKQFGKIPGVIEQNEINRQNIITRQTGCPIGHVKDSLTSGSQGPLCVQDLDLLEKLQHFNTEKIPPRNVHALGTGAYGTFTVTNDISKYTCADLFNQVGKSTQFITRFSGIFTEVGDPETTRDVSF